MFVFAHSTSYYLSQSLGWQRWILRNKKIYWWNLTRKSTTYDRNNGTSKDITVSGTTCTTTAWQKHWKILKQEILWFICLHNPSLPQFEKGNWMTKIELVELNLCNNYLWQERWNIVKQKKKIFYVHAFQRSLTLTVNRDKKSEEVACNEYKHITETVKHLEPKMFISHYIHE